MNGIHNAHIVYSWQQLTIPSEATLINPLNEAVGIHIVQRGETLDLIAKSYGIDLLELQTLNNLWTWLIYPGDELLLPVEGHEPAAPAHVSAEEPETPPASRNRQRYHSYREAWRDAGHDCRQLWC